MPDLESQVDHIEDDVLRLVFLSCHPSPHGRLARRADAAPRRRPHDGRDRARLC